MRIVGIVPAKGSSERLPSKNLKILGGEHLFRRKLIQLLESKLISEVWLDTESDEVVKLVGSLPVKILKRDPRLAANSTDGHALFKNECDHIGKADIVVQALCTAPFVEGETIDRALAQLMSYPDRDSLVAVYRRRQYVWKDDRPAYGSGPIPNSISLDPTCIEAMSLYMMKAGSKRFPDYRIGENPILFELAAKETIDIDDYGDFELAQKIANAALLEEAQKFQVLKTSLTTAMIADILKDRGEDGILPHQIKPLSGTKVLGRAKTLKLCRLPEHQSSKSEEWKGIYGALVSYDYIRSGDVIVVSSDVRERAYFGDLNAHLAIRSGAVGAIVDGLTRDIERVQALGFPVFARGAWCNDIKYEGTVEQMNQPVSIDGCFISNRDVILGDQDGVVRIPARIWPQVLEEALHTLRNELNIRIDAMLGCPINDILGKRGTF